MGPIRSPWCSESEEGKWPRVQQCCYFNGRVLGTKISYRHLTFTFLSFIDVFIHPLTFYADKNPAKGPPSGRKATTRIRTRTHRSAGYANQNWTSVVPMCSAGHHRSPCTLFYALKRSYDAIAQRRYMHCRLPWVVAKKIVARASIRDVSVCYA